ncbi:Translation elongation factor, putative, partial [Candida maltosa Xu316]
MSQGTLYVMEVSPRSAILVDLVKYFKLDVEISTETKSDAFLKKFPLGKTPAFVGAKGYKLTETIAIAVYLLSLVPEQKLLGKNNQENASIIKYLSFFNQEVANSWCAAFFRLNGRFPYNKKEVDENLKVLETIAGSLDARLADFTYLVGERVSYADFFGVKVFAAVTATLLGKPFFQKYANINRWFKTVSNNDFFQGQYKNFQVPEQQLAFVPPKKEKKKEAAPAAAKKEQAPKKKEADEEAEPAAAPKPKHPLEALGKPKAALDEWKRVYSNEETRETAIP